MRKTRNRYKKHSGRNRRLRRHVLLTAVLILAVLGAAFAVRACMAAVALPSVTLTEPGEITVQDRYQGSMRIPKYDLPLNAYADAKFTQQDGIKQYQDADAAAGVDVSSWQGEIDWDAVKKAGIQFAFVRVGFRGQTEGQIYLDQRFEANLKGALAAGLDAGVYFYSQAVSKEEAAQEADFVLQHIRGYNLRYPVVYDWEPADVLDGEAVSAPLRTGSVTGADVTGFTKVFCEKVRGAGYQPCYYTNKSMGYGTFDLEALAGYPIWYAEYRDLPSFYYHFALWQYTNAGTVPGIPEPVDLNISFQKFQ